MARMADRPDDPADDPTDDPTPLSPLDPEQERRLREVLARRADQIHPSDRFADIQARVGPERSARGWLWPVAVAAVLVIVVGAVGIPRLVARNQAYPSSADGQAASQTAPVPVPAPAASGSATPQASSSSAVASPSSTASSASAAPATSTAAYPIYYLGSSLQRTEAGAGTSQVRLYREFHRLPVAASRLDKVAAAVTAMATIRPDDPDYLTAWPTIGAVTVRTTGGGLLVDLGADGFPAALPNSFTAAQALQQLVWTATAAYGDAVPVTVLVGGRTNVSWGKDLFGRPVSRDLALKSPVWITDPVTGQRDHAGRVTVTGVSTAFEGTVAYQIRAAKTGDVVAEGSAQGGANGVFAPFEFSADLPAGSYTVVVYAPDASGANPLGEGDSKTWTVV